MCPQERLAEWRLVFWEAGRREKRGPLASGVEADPSLSASSRLRQETNGAGSCFQHLSGTRADQEDKKEVMAWEGAPVDHGLPAAEASLAPSPAGWAGGAQV